MLKYICHAMSWTELFDTDVCSIAMASLYFAATLCTRHALHWMHRRSKEHNPVLHCNHCMKGKSTIVLRPANQILKEDGSRSQLWLCASAPRVQGAALKIFVQSCRRLHCFAQICNLDKIARRLHWRRCGHYLGGWSASETFSSCLGQTFVIPGESLEVLTLFLPKQSKNQQWKKAYMRKSIRPPIIGYNEGTYLSAGACLCWCWSGVTSAPWSTTFWSTLKYFYPPVRRGLGSIHCNVKCVEACLRAWQHRVGQWAITWPTGTTRSAHTLGAHITL